MKRRILNTLIWVATIWVILDGVTNNIGVLDPTWR